MSYREFLTVRFLGVLVLLPALFALGEVLDHGAGWGWWLAGGVAWLAVCGLLYYRRLRAEAGNREASADTARPES